jgi:hypothetical protein
MSHDVQAAIAAVSDVQTAIAAALATLPAEDLESLYPPIPYPELRARFREALSSHGLRDDLLDALFNAAWGMQRTLAYAERSRETGRDRESYTPEMMTRKAKGNLRLPMTIHQRKILGELAFRRRLRASALLAWRSVEGLTTSHAAARLPRTAASAMSSHPMT